MFRNYFITAFRNIIRNKIQSFIQVLSLAIGITAAILIGLYAKYELSYDRYNEKFDRIYRLQWGDQVGLWSAIGHQIKQEIPEVENVVRLVNYGGKDRILYIEYIPSGDSTDRRSIAIEDFFWCDTTIFDVFTFHFIQGDPNTALRDPYSTVLTESMARKIFGEKDPIGEQIDRDYTITGIIEDVKHSHIEINMLSSMESLEAFTGDTEMLNSYDSPSFMTYLLLPEGSDPVWLEKRINEFFIEKWRENSPDYEPETRFSLLPVEDIYFTTGMEREINYCLHGNLKLLKVLIAVSLLILILAIINYVNLTTARASLRAREIGIRNVVGASKSRLISQFLVEALAVTILSFVIALTLVQLLLPVFNQLAMTDLDMDFLNNPATYIWALFSIIALGVISGLYPALYLTGFKTIRTLSGDLVTGTTSVIFRRLLLTFQFTISIVLVIGLLVIFMQLSFMKKADPGFNKEYVIFKNEYRWQHDQSKRRVFRQQLLENPNVTGVAFSSNMIGNEIELIWNGGTRELNGNIKQVAYMGVDPYFFDVMEIKLVDGRNLSFDRVGDYEGAEEGYTQKILVNETFVREFDLEAPVGYHKWTNGGTFEIIGIVRDFNFNSQHEKILPTMFYWSKFKSDVSIKMSPENIQSTLRYIRKVYLDMFDDAVEFDYTFLDDHYAKQYLRDERTARIIFNFALVAVLIACLGLFGLSAFMAARRTKEIGIRKSMGASVQSVFLLLSREFIKWIVISVAIACPAAWFIMNKWLQSFAYRTNISWWIFALAILIAFAIAFITVTWQSLKTARTNPVEALRYE